MQNSLTFKAENRTLQEVLFASRRFRVPRYQRPYAWDIEQVSEFWEDLVSAEEPYFLGSFIFNTEQEKAEGYVDIIDGQQRILTITIFASALRDIAKTIDPDTSKLYQRQDIAMEDRSGRYSFRILPSETLKDYFLTYIQQDSSHISNSSPETVEETKVKRNYQYLHEKVSSEIKRFPSRELQIDVLNSLRAKMANLIIINVDIGREEDAYEIFETTNARGVDLSVSDLLKNLVFKKIPPGDDRDFAKEVWQEITTDIEEADTELKRFIRYFWISRYGFVPEKKVYREVKNKITDWQQLLTDLWDDSRCFNRLLEGNGNDFDSYKHGVRIFNAVSALRLMRVSQCYVLLIAILRNYDRLGTDPVRVFELVEKFTFQYSVVCKMPGNKLEKIYSRFALRLEEAVNTSQSKRIPGAVQAVFSDLEKELRTEAPSEVVFKEAFNRDISYKNSEQSRKLIKYILAKLDSHFRETDEQLIDFNRVNVEHVLPQNPSKDWKLSKREIKTYVNLLGNLTLLSKVINSKIQNGLVKYKLPELAVSELPITKNLVTLLKENKEKWGEPEIRERQKYFADISYGRIWKL